MIKYEILKDNPEIIRKNIGKDTVRVQLVETGIKLSNVIVEGPEDIIALIGKEMELFDREHTRIIHISTGNKIIAIETISIGTLESAPIHFREVFKGAILSNAAGIIFVHNHPGGRATPSAEDKNVFKAMSNVGYILGIKVLDAIIIGDDEFYSRNGDKVVQYEIR